MLAQCNLLAYLTFAYIVFFFDTYTPFEQVRFAFQCQPLFSLSPSIHQRCSQTLTSVFASLASAWALGLVVPYCNSYLLHLQWEQINRKCIAPMDGSKIDARFLPTSHAKLTDLQLDSAGILGQVPVLYINEPQQILFRCIHQIACSQLQRKSC